MRLNGFADEIQSLTTEAESLSADPERRVEAEKLMARCDLLAAKREREEKTLAWTEWVQPFVQRHAPKTPFGTLLWAVGWLLATSIIKGVLLVISAILVARVANRTARDLRRV
ncbi:MAG: hypothetical protein ACK53V_14285, partial [Planctomycetota bacterium]